MADDHDSSTTGLTRWTLEHEYCGFIVIQINTKPNIGKWMLGDGVAPNFQIRSYLPYSKNKHWKSLLISVLTLIINNNLRRHRQSIGCFNRRSVLTLIPLPRDPFSELGGPHVSTKFLAYSRRLRNMVWIAISPYTRPSDFQCRFVLLLDRLPHIYFWEVSLRSLHLRSISL